MNFQENKFSIILGAITAVVAGGLIFWGLKSGGRYAAAEEEFQSAESEMTNLTRKPVKPTDDNRRAKLSALRDYASSVENLQQTFDPYRRPNPPNVEPSAFVDALLAAKDRLDQQFGEHDATLPEQFFLGMGRFTTQQPSRSETGLLSFALGAFEDLFGRLAAADPSELLNVYWANLPESDDDRYLAHSIEITFRGSEASLREFLGSLDNSEEYYYVVRVMRVQNSRDTAPNARDARFEQPAAEVPEDDDNPFGAGGFVFPDEEDEEGDEDGEGDEGDGDAGVEPAAEEPASDAASDSGQILKQVLGSEKIEVFLRIDVLQFLTPQELPEV